MLLAIMENSARAISLADRPQDHGLQQPVQYLGAHRL